MGKAVYLNQSQGSYSALQLSCFNSFTPTTAASSSKPTPSNLYRQKQSVCSKNCCSVPAEPPVCRLHTAAGRNLEQRRISRCQREKENKQKQQDQQTWVKYWKKHWVKRELGIKPQIRQKYKHGIQLKEIHLQKEEQPQKRGIENKRRMSLNLPCEVNADVHLICTPVNNLHSSSYMLYESLQDKTQRMYKTVLEQGIYSPKLGLPLQTDKFNISKVLKESDKLNITKKFMEKIHFKFI